MFRTLVGAATLATAGATASLPTSPLASGLLLAIAACAAAGAVHVAESARRPAPVTAAPSARRPG